MGLYNECLLGQLGPWGTKSGRGDAKESVRHAALGSQKVKPPKPTKQKTRKRVTTTAVPRLGLEKLT